MRYLDEFRDPRKAERLIAALEKAADKALAKTGASVSRPLKIMEFCGGHTHSIFRYGINQLLPKTIELVHGPGCPVCVLPMGRVDDAVAIAERPEVIFTSFGDALRVPGSRISLLGARARGADVRVVYSPLDSLKLARENPDKQVVFFALGFETTMPGAAMTLLQAQRQGLDNFSLLCNHITTVPTIKAILDSPGMSIDGFIAPGHVSMVVGESPFTFVPQVYAKPLVISGFEPLDILQSLWMLIRQMADGRCELENQYARVAAKQGNPAALEAISRVFCLRDCFEWRGLGSIDHSGVKLTDEFAGFDAEQRFAVPGATIADPKSCQCGEVLKGVLRPAQCKLFGRACTPEKPMGALMVSSEGACAAYYQYARGAKSDIGAEA